MTQGGAPLPQVCPVPLKSGVPHLSTCSDHSLAADALSLCRTHCLSQLDSAPPALWPLVTHYMTEVPNSKREQPWCAQVPQVPQVRVRAGPGCAGPSEQCPDPPTPPCLPSTPDTVGFTSFFFLHYSIWNMIWAVIFKQTVSIENPLCKQVRQCW